MMRKGFTTGSCAAAAAGAATFMLLSGEETEKFEITTPAGMVYRPEILKISKGSGEVSCAVKKDAGDDPDITNGILVFAKAAFGGEKNFNLKAGEGIGRVTRPGLSRPVGDFAINNMPRKMIEDEVRNQMENFDFEGPLTITIYVPRGAEIAAKTFNPEMGIEGGISILGTTGIVEPKSAKAFTDTIRLQLGMMKSEGMNTAVIVPGNYGMTFLGKEYDFPQNKIVPCGNFVGDAMDAAVDAGFDKILFAGHIGKLVKVSGGVMNTHSSEGDRRLELLFEAAMEAADKKSAAEKLQLLSAEMLSATTTSAGLEILDGIGLTKETCRVLLEKIMRHLNGRAKPARVEVILYESDRGVLAKSGGADDFIRLSLLPKG